MNTISFLSDMNKIKDLTGQKFGKLTVINYAGRNNHLQTLWLCKCDCGNEIIRSGNRLKQESNKSCGCIKNAKNLNGLSKHSLYRHYNSMKNRCYNKNSKAYKDWGERGISVCEEWRNDFKLFYDWAMQNGWKKGLTLDRINVNGNYEPSNCRWITILEQANNMRSNIFIEYKGKTKTIAQWSRILGIRYETLHGRINTPNWSIERAFETPVRKFVK